MKEKRDYSKKLHCRCGFILLSKNLSVGDICPRCGKGKLFIPLEKAEVKK